jgi:DNA-binding CsgD family transcriptional regulator
MRDEARRQGNLHAFALGSWYLADVNLRAGDLGASEADARQALRVLSGFEYIHGYAVGHLVTVLLERGALREAADRLHTSDLPDAPPYANAHLGALAARARLSAARADWRQALDDWLAIGDRRLADGRINPSLELWRSSAAQCHLALGDRGAARGLADEELQLARAFGAPRALGRALRVAGLVEGGQAGMALLREAVEVLGESPVRLEHARALVDWGAALRRAGKRGEPARAPLREALDIATRCGAVSVAEQARAELLAAGAKPRRTALRGAAALTPSERRVAELATEGLTNREIAQTLFITIKTVEDHLRNTYRKLEVAGKGDLAGAMASEAPAGGLR